MNTEHTKHPCETVDASADVMKLAGMILSDCGCSTAISDRLQRRVAGRIQLHMDSVAQQLELERGSLFAESQRKQQLQGQVDALMEAMAKISRMTMSMYTSAGEAMRDAKRIAHEAIAAAEQAQQADHIGGVNEMAQQAKPVALSLPFFVYDSETGFERFATEAEAKAAAQESIEAYREDAGEGWAEEVENICWGVVLGTTREVELPDEYSGGNGLADSMKSVDYVLTDAAQPPAVTGAAPDGSVPVPLGFLQAFHALAHNYSLQAQAPDHYAGTERDAFSDAYARCGSELAKLRAMLAAAPQAAVAAPLPPYNVFSDDEGDSWREHPADADFVEGLQLGDEFELLAGWRSVRVTFRVTKVPDDESDDYEVEEVTAPAAAQKGGAA